jgi:acyl transferase domain-containing protein
VLDADSLVVCQVLICNYKLFVIVRDFSQLWQMLCKGKDCITEVPTDRWSIEKFYDPTPQTPGKSVSKYGGFVGNKSFAVLFTLSINPL